jgi:hypothetical protein
MLISYNWLRDYCETQFSPEELRERLTMVGLATASAMLASGAKLL